MKIFYKPFKLGYSKITSREKVYYSFYMQKTCYAQTRAEMGSKMKKEIRTICYDEELRIEAYRLEGIVQTFPNHFHEYYVIGYIEGGRRFLSCKNVEYNLDKGDIVLFNPEDNHTCMQIDDRALDYRGINVPKSAMLDLVEEVTGERVEIKFNKSVIYDQELACYLREIHDMIMTSSNEFEKEENLLIIISMLIDKYSEPIQNSVLEYAVKSEEEIERACKFLNEHYTERICLEQICKYAGLSKSTLLRGFTKLKGVTPYRYLENIRINKAKKLLEKGVSLVDAANQTGFCDQSHFTNYFNMFIGVSPGVYRDIFREKTLKSNTEELKGEE